MANSHFSLSSLTLLALTILFLSSPATSTSRRALDRKKPPTGFRVSLHHVDAGGNYTKFERLRRATTRGTHRLQRLNKLASADPDEDVQAPVHAGDGEFLMGLAIGTPPEKYMAIMDTGSDLIWTQCQPCGECFEQSTPIFDPEKSSSFSKMSCSSALCSALPQSRCRRNGCDYLYVYGDYSSTAGVMGTETFTFDTNSVENIGFGCGLDNLGDGFSQGAGLVGLGRGPLSLVSQLKEPKFSYCLTPISNTNTTSTLLMGSLAAVNLTGAAADSLQTTPLLSNANNPSFYYLSLQGISVGNTRLPVNPSTFALRSDGSGGLIIDSGTTITYLEQTAFDILKVEFTSQMGLPVDDEAAEATGLDLCFSLPDGGGAGLEVPKLVFHFDGAELDLPADNYLIADSGMGVVCLVMGGSSGMSIFGNFQQQNMLVLHDLVKETLSFLPTQCDKM